MKEKQGKGLGRAEPNSHLIQQRLFRDPDLALRMVLFCFVSIVVKYTKHNTYHLTILKCTVLWH